MRNICFENSQLVLCRQIMVFTGISMEHMEMTRKRLGMVKEKLKDPLELFKNKTVLLITIVTVQVNIK